MGYAQEIVSRARGTLPPTQAGVVGGYNTIIDDRASNLALQCPAASL